MITPQIVAQYFPKAVQWATEMEKAILERGQRLLPQSRKDAEAIGVQRVQPLVTPEMITTHLLSTRVEEASEPNRKIPFESSTCPREVGPWGAMGQWMQLRFIVRGIGHRAATIWASSTATLFVLFAAATGTAFVSTRFGCLQPDCLPA
jgi:hypothetical protein